MAQKNNNPKTKGKSKMIWWIAGGAASLIVLAALLGGGGGAESTKSTLAGGGVNTGEVRDSADPDYINDVKAQQAAEASAAMSSNDTHIPQPLNKADKEQNLDDLFAQRPESASEPVIATASDAGMPVAPPAPQPVIYREIIEKEVAVPLPTKEKYDYKKDSKAAAMFLTIQARSPRESYGVQDTNKGMLSNQTIKSEEQEKIAREKQMRDIEFQARMGALQGKLSGAGNVGVGGTLFEGGQTTKPDLLFGAEGQSVTQRGLGGSAEAGGGKSGENAIAHIAHPKGDLIAAVLETGINTTRPSMVRAVIQEGDLAGAVLVGNFAKNGLSVTVNFDTLMIPELKRSFPMSAVAVDFKDASTALAHSVNRHIPERLLFNLASSYGKNYADILRNNNQTQESVSKIGNSSEVSNKTVTRPKTPREINREAGAQAISDSLKVVQEAIPSEPTIKVRGNSEIGVFFTADFVLPADVYESLKMGF